MSKRGSSSSSSNAKSGTSSSKGTDPLAPSNFTPEQNESIERLIQFTSVPRARAVALLKQHHWSIQSAADEAFEQQIDLTGDEGAVDVEANTTTAAATGKASGGPKRGPGANGAANQKKINAWFDSLRDEPDDMEIDGISKFCAQLQVDPEDPVLLVIAYEMKAERMLHFSREEFVRGMTSLGVTDAGALQAILPGLRDVLKRDTEEFRKVYAFCYKFALEPGQRVMNKEVAVALWGMLLSSPYTRFCKEWCDYITQFHKHGISSDLYTQTLKFASEVGLDFGAYDENQSSWPSAVDEFIEYMRKRSGSR